MSQILKFKITLEEIEPPIWRRFLVEDSISFESLHYIIQIIMGWTNSHMHNFQVDEKKYVEMDTKEFFSIDSMWSAIREDDKAEKLSEKETKLSDIITEEGKWFLYTYDFGDNWVHIIELEKIMSKQARKKYPICIEGERACPPEDCGSVPGYENLLEILKNKKHPEYKEMKEWVGKKYDPESFSVEKVNKNLKNVDYIML